jgi:hypothetical protein
MRRGLLDGLGLAKWPSVALITVVPAWFLLDGWNGGFGSARVAVATVEADGARYRLWRSSERGATETWCAQPLDSVRPTAQLDFVRGGEAAQARFDAGSFCADLAVGADVPRLLPR